MVLEDLKSELNKIEWESAEDFGKIDLAFDEDSLIQILKDTADTSWGRNTLDYETIQKWLDNFTGQVYERAYERILALIIAVHMVYYDEDAICHLVKLAYKKLLHEVMEREHVDLIEATESVAFLPLGTVSESGPFLSYYFRRENGLSTDFFVNTLENVGRIERIRNIVLLDDVSISGSQVERYIKNMKKKGTFFEKILQERNLYALFLMSTVTAKEKLKLHNVKLCTPIFMDERSECFSEESSIYKIFDKNIRDVIRIQSKKMARYYGCILLSRQYMINGEFQRILDKNKETEKDIILKKAIQKVRNDALGYDNAQMLIAFEYNTPNNTLPIIWVDDQQWSPLFKRYDKLYSKQVIGGIENENIYI